MGEAQKVAAQTNAVLKSTGKAAHVSAKQVEDMAESLMTMSGVDDELIQQGENLLLTFKNIRNETGRGNDIFDQATKAMLDMSVALGQDATSSAIQLGKALNDPVKGVTALRRVGVSFTAAQIKQIKTLVATGKTLQAQKLILRELNQEFGGSREGSRRNPAGQAEHPPQHPLEPGREHRRDADPGHHPARQQDDRLADQVARTRNGCWTRSGPPPTLSPPSSEY